MNIFDELLSFAQAAREWDIDDSTLRKAVSSGKLVEGVDAKKFGKQWVITKSAMRRLYGEPKNKSCPAED